MMPHSISGWVEASWLVTLVRLALISTYFLCEMAVRSLGSSATSASRIIRRRLSPVTRDTVDGDALGLIGGSAWGTTIFCGSCAPSKAAPMPACSRKARRVFPGFGIIISALTASITRGSGWFGKRCKMNGVRNAGRPQQFMTRRDMLWLLGSAAPAARAQHSTGMASRGVAPQPRGKPSGLPFHARFTDVAAQAGLHEPVVYGPTGRTDYILESMGCGVAFLDYDNDGWLDVFVLSGPRPGGPR